MSEQRYGGIQLAVFGWGERAQRRRQVRFRGSTKVPLVLKLMRRRLTEVPVRQEDTLHTTLPGYVQRFGDVTTRGAPFESAGFGVRQRCLCFGTAGALLVNNP